MKPYKLGKIAGFEVNIDWSWIVIFLLVVISLGDYYFPASYPRLPTAAYRGMGVIAAVLFFMSLLAHELMHSVVARRYGIEIKGITLYIFGGMSQTGSEPKTPTVEFNMAIIGPFTSLVLAAIFYGIAFIGNAGHWPIPIIGIATYLGLVNLLLGIFNLAPGFPLDGGRMFRSLLWAATNNLEKATRYASYAGQIFGYFLIITGVYTVLFAGSAISGLWLIFIGWYLTGIARSSYEQVVLREALSGVEVERVMTTDVPTVAAEVTVDDFVDHYLLHHEYSCYPVVWDDKVQGVVGIDEVRSVPRDQWSVVTVGQIAHPVGSENVIRKEDDAWDALLKLAVHNTRRLLVMDNGTLDGTVSQESILRLVRTKLQLQD